MTGIIPENSLRLAPVRICIKSYLSPAVFHPPAPMTPLWKAPMTGFRQRSRAVMPSCREKEMVMGFHRQQIVD